jgi:hypothetical protein
MGNMFESGGNALNYNVAIGYEALHGEGSAVCDETVAVGAYALKELTSGAKNLAVGYSALQGLTTGANNIAIGYEAADAMVGTESDNIAIGYGAMGAMDEDNESIDSNIAIGRGAMFGGDMASGDADRDYTKNMAIGNYAMDDCGYIGGTDNVFIGEDSGGGTWTGDESNYNVGIGNTTLDAAMNGALRNTALGNGAATSVTTGDDNVCIGAGSGGYITTGSKNTIIGSEANTGAGNNDNLTAIGYDCEAPDKSNIVVLGNASVKDVYMAYDRIKDVSKATVHCGAVVHGLSAILLTTGTLAYDTHSIVRGKYVTVSADAQILTLPAVVVGAVFIIVNIAADGGALLTIDPNGSDKFLLDIAGAAGTDGNNISNTKTTQNQGDFVKLVGMSADGWAITEIGGIWADE